MLAIILCLLHKTHPEVRPLPIPFTGQCWLSQTRFNVILYEYYGPIWRYGCGLVNKIGLHLNREQNDALSYIILETRTAKVVIRFEVRLFLSRGYFLSYSHLAIPAKLHGPKGDQINKSLLYTSIMVVWLGCLNLVSVQTMGNL